MAKLSNKKLDELALKQKALKQKIEKLEDELASVNDEIKEMLGDTTEYNTKVFKFTFKEVIKTLIDSRAVKSKYPAIFEECSKQSVSRPLLIN